MEAFVSVGGGGHSDEERDSELVPPQVVLTLIL